MKGTVWRAEKRHQCQPLIGCPAKPRRRVGGSTGSQLQISLALDEQIQH